MNGPIKFCRQSRCGQNVNAALYKNMYRIDVMSTGMGQRVRNTEHTILFYSVSTADHLPSSRCHPFLCFGLNVCTVASSVELCDVSQ